MRSNTSLRVTVLVMLVALVALATYVYYNQQVQERLSPLISSPSASSMDDSSPDNVNLCVEYQGIPEEPSKWWQWACLIDRYLMTQDYSCEKRVGKGNWHICMDAPYAVQAPCLVYSFGINNEWNFDDLMSQNFSCDVHSFDPSMGKKDFQRNPHNKFYDLGLGWENTDSYQPHADRYVRRKQTWRMRTLKTIMKELGHQDRTLDVLKMDIELSEWPVIAELLRDGSALPRVRQFLVEWHVFPGDRPPRSQLRQFYSSLRRLRELGFLAFKNNRGQLQVYNKPAEYRFFAEMGYVNTKFRK